MDVKQNAEKTKGGTILNDLIEIFGRGADKLVSTAHLASKGQLKEQDEMKKLEVAVRDSLQKHPELRQLSGSHSKADSTRLDSAHSLRRIFQDLSEDSQAIAPKMLRLGENEFVPKEEFDVALRKAGLLDGDEAKQEAWHRIFERCPCSSSVQSNVRSNFNVPGMRRSGRRTNTGLWPM